MRKLLSKVLDVDSKLEEEMWAKFPEKKLYDREVSKFAFEHMKFIGMLSFRKITTAVLSSFAIMSEEDFDEEEYRGWKFDLKRKGKGKEK